MALWPLLVGERSRGPRTDHTLSSSAPCPAGLEQEPSSWEPGSCLGSPAADPLVVASWSAEDWGIGRPAQGTRGLRVLLACSPRPGLALRAILLRGSGMSVASWGLGGPRTPSTASVGPWLQGEARCPAPAPACPQAGPQPGLTGMTVTEGLDPHSVPESSCLTGVWQWQEAS